MQTEGPTDLSVGPFLFILLVYFFSSSSASTKPRSNIITSFNVLIFLAFADLSAGAAGFSSLGSSASSGSSALAGSSAAFGSSASRTSCIGTVCAVAGYFPVKRQRTSALGQRQGQERTYHGLWRL